MNSPEPICLVFVHGLFSSPKAWAPMIRLVESDPDLLGMVTVNCFKYDSPFIKLRPDRRIAEMEDIADRLRTYLLTELQDAGRLVLVTHSQGGLVVQRFLARMVGAGRARELARIKRILMYACPNPGSDFFLGARRAAVLWRNAQEQQLRPHIRAVVEAQETVLRAVVNSDGCNETHCHIPIIACGGVSDNIVPPTSANWVFPTREVVDGDHATIIRPDRLDSGSYQVLKSAILAALDPVAAPAPAADGFPERLAGVSVTPPYGKRDAQLQGRADLLVSIRRENERSRVHILAGLGGSGKSRLALELAFLAQQSGKRVWWVQVNRVSSSMLEVANELGVPENQAERAWRGTGSAADLVWHHLDAKEDPWLLIFDNADDPEVLGSDSDPVSDGTGWLRSPGSPNGMVLVTSRDRDEATWGSWTVVHRVRTLSDDDGAMMLLDLMGEEGGSYQDAMELSAELGGLPLALRAAARYLKSVIGATVWQGESSIRNFDAYRVAVKARFESPPGVRSLEISEDLGFEIMKEVFDLSLELLDHRGLAQTAPLLRLFACLNMAPIPYYLLLDSEILAQSPLFDEFTALQRLTVLEGLANLGLVETAKLERIADPTVAHVLTLHPMVHGTMREDKDVKERRTDYYGLNIRMLLRATENLDPDLPESWVVWDVVAPHSVEVSRTSLLGSPAIRDRRVTVQALHLARLTIRYLIVMGLLGPASDLVEPIVASCAEFGLRADDQEILALRHEKGRIALERGDPEAAEAELREVIAGRERILGENHHETLASRHKIAKAILEQGRWAEAEPLLRSIVEAEKHVRGEEHSDTMVVRHSLARAILAQSRPAEAETMIRDILKVRYRHWSPITPETLYVRQTLARSLMEQGDAEGAEETVRSALSDAAGRPDSPQVISLRHTLSEALLMQVRLAEAVSDLERVVTDRRRVLGLSHPGTKRAEADLAMARKALAHRGGPADPAVP